MKTLLLWMALFPLFIAPGSALVAGVVTWAMTRGRRPQDGELVKHFLVVMAMLSLAAAGFLSSDWLKRKLDPSIEARERFVAMPVHAALQKHMPFEWERVEQAADAALAGRATLVQLQAQARLHYPALARRLLPFAQRDAALAYAEAVVSALRELESAEPDLCVSLAWPSAKGAPFDLNAHLSSETATAYEAAVAQLVRHNSQATPKPPPGPPEAPGTNSLHDMQMAYLAIREAMEPRYGEAVRQLHTEAVVRLPPAQACSATIELLSRSLAQTPPVARMLVTNMLRT